MKFFLVRILTSFTQVFMSYNAGHNVQCNFDLALDIQFNKLGMRVASRALRYQETRKYWERLKTEQGDEWRKMNKTSRNEFLGKAIKNYEKADIKVFCCCSILLDSFTFGQIF